MRISDWSSDVCSSDLPRLLQPHRPSWQAPQDRDPPQREHSRELLHRQLGGNMMMSAVVVGWRHLRHRSSNLSPDAANLHLCRDRRLFHGAFGQTAENHRPRIRSEEHTSELQSLMRISYAVFCLKKKRKTNTNN